MGQEDPSMEFPKTLLDFSFRFPDDDACILRSVPTVRGKCSRGTGPRRRHQLVSAPGQLRAIGRKRGSRLEVCR
jgi:hypothetical protein